MARKPILVVEDDPEIRKLVRTILERNGHTVLEAPHGAAALEQLEQGPLPGLVLLDLYLPVMDGWEFRRSQLARPRLAAIPVVVITAAADGLVEPIEAEQVIKKPLDIGRLLDVVRRYCDEPSGTGA